MMIPVFFAIPASKKKHKQWSKHFSFATPKIEMSLPFFYRFMTTNA
jgi:hypothetical protein